MRANSAPPVPLRTRLALSATAGCVASTFCQPLDVIRVQLQTNTGGVRVGNPLQAATGIVRSEGVRGLWSGLSAAYLRQFTYSGFRMAIYSYLLDATRRANGHTGAVPISTKLMLGAAAGVGGSIVGNPAEIALVRMSYDSKLPVAARRNYKSSLHACVRIVQEEGVGGLARGACRC